MAVFNEKGTHHCELVSIDANGYNSNYYNCKMNPGHKNYFTVNEFGMGHLPKECRSDDVMNYIQNVIDRTVKITASYTSKNRPDTFPNSPMRYPFREHRGSKETPRCGTGFISRVLSELALFGNHPCPCPECKKSNRPKMEYWRIVLTTATHVVFDLTELEGTEVELFYHGENKEGVKLLYPVDILNDAKIRYETDQCEIICVTHDEKLAQQLESLCAGFEDMLMNFMHLRDVFLKNQTGIIVSHPHGISKRISIGKIFEKYICVKSGTRISMNKGASIFVPFDKDKQEETQNREQASVSDRKRSKKFLDHEQSISSSQATGEETQETDQTVKRAETVTSKTQCSLHDFLNPTTDKSLFELKEELYCIPPPESFMVRHSLETEGWYTLPVGTEYISQDGRSMVLKSIIKFYRTSSYILPPPIQRKTFLTYDMATCPGSSGAFIHGDIFLKSSWSHFGCNGVKNQSGLKTFL